MTRDSPKAAQQSASPDSNQVSSRPQVSPFMHDALRNRRKAICYVVHQHVHVEGIDRVETVGDCGGHPVAQNIRTGLVEDN